MSSTINNTEWEKEFDKYWFISKERTKGSTNAHRYEVKAFISSLLTNKIKEIENKIKANMFQRVDTPGVNYITEERIDWILETLQEK